MNQSNRLNWKVSLDLHCIQKKKTRAGPRLPWLAEGEERDKR